MQAVLGGLLKNRRLATSLRRVMVMSLWEQVVGAVIAQHSWPERVTDGVLHIVVSTHVWADELHVLKPQILSRYRQVLGRTAVRDMEFRIGRRRKKDLDEGRHPRVALYPQPQEKLPVAPVPSHLLEGVNNPEVREMLAPAFARLRAEREWKQEHGWRRCPRCHRVYHGADCPHCGGGPEAA